MTRFALVFSLIFLCSFKTISQLNCNNWLYTPSYQSYFSVGDLDIPGNKVTLEAVINRTQPYLPGIADNTEGDVISKHIDPSNANYLLRPNHAYVTTTNGFFATPDVCEIELNKTYHIAMVYDGVTLKYYRNGFLLSSVPASGNLFQNNFETRIGLYDDVFWNTNFLGYINEVRIWNVARTQAEIRAYMNTSLPSPATQMGLQAYYTFDNLLNKQGNPLWNGTLGGSATIGQSNPTCASFVADSCAAVVNQEYIINDYTEVLGMNPCKNTLSVNDASSFNIGDTVLLIQMKGAKIDSTNSASFGNIIDYRNAGNYEFNIIAQKNGNNLDLLNIITRQYDIADGKVQLVRVPYYQDYTVPPGYSLTCLPWDGSKGGVLAFNVQNSITVLGDIDVTGKGFVGGAGNNIGQLTINCFTNGYYYASNTATAAAKGESIVNLSNNYFTGKGSPAAGGGGGLDHNSGGGGGANGGPGGFGGYQLEPCGNSPFDNRGLGGKALPYSNAANKIFLGSGGGAGQANNPGNLSEASSGGNGGGIIIISAQSIQMGGATTIVANGADAPGCSIGSSLDCHDAMGGGGGGGTILLNIPTIINPTNVQIKGGKGADMIAPIIVGGRIGPGGGGGGGLFWSSIASLPANITLNATGGAGGVLTADANNPWGTTPGQNGFSLFNLQLPIDNVLFKANIDSVRIRTTQTSCSSFSFEGLGYTNTSAITSWQWYFGDGDTAKTQNATHKYGGSGTYTVKLVVTDGNGCMDSITTNLTGNFIDVDFTYSIDVCNPLIVQFAGVGTIPTTIEWNTGDGSPVTTGVWSFSKTYATEGVYDVRLIASNGVCTDTISKTISVRIVRDNIILTPDTTICIGNTKQLRSAPSLGFCWSPTTYLDNPNSPNPITSTPQNITYYLTAQVTGNNIITNGDFSAGNSGFSSAYFHTPNNVTEGEYFIGTNPRTWNGTLSACKDHTSGGGNMMMVNGSPVVDVNVWKQTVIVTPNTNYAFSTWIQSLWDPNPAQLQFSINGKTIGNLITASLPTCTWTQFYTTWNSGNTTTAEISIVNKNTQIQGNDFALDDISFAPVFIRRDSVVISIETASVQARTDTLICEGAQAPLMASGASTYSWVPGTSLNNSNIANPVAKPVVSTQYIVTGTSVNGCLAKDTVNINVNAKPPISKSADAAICENGSVQIFASGGNTYEWTPQASLNNPSISNPIASPTTNTTYHVLVTDANTCTNTDSVKVTIRPDPVFTISEDASVCAGTSSQLIAGGGDVYAWQPAETLNNTAIANPVASPTSNTTYTVLISDTVCGNIATLSTTINVRPAPVIAANKTNDIDCTNGTSQLSASGGRQYQWDPSATLNNAAIANPVASPRTPTKYTVKGTDAFGCSNTDSVFVDFQKINEGLYLMPSAFSPNNDGLNDCFRAKYWGFIFEFDFSVFNRWGERVFHTKNPSDCWDGTYKGIPQKSDAYVYIIKAKTLCEESVFKKGTITLIR